MRRIFRDYREALDNTRDASPSAATCRSTSRATTCRSSRCPTGKDLAGYFAEVAREGLERRLDAMAPLFAAKRKKHEPQEYRDRLETRDRDHQEDGLPRLLPRRLGLHQIREGQRHPGRPGPRLRGGLAGRVLDGHHRRRSARVRPPLRALPQPRAHLDARHRHRLLHEPPRRGHRVRRATSTARTTSRRSSPSGRWRRSRSCATSAACSDCRTASSTKSPRRSRPARTSRCRWRRRSRRALAEAMKNDKEVRAHHRDRLAARRALAPRRHARRGRRHHARAGHELRPALPHEPR